MNFARLLRDATNSAPSASQRSQEIALAQLLNEKHGAGSITAKGVSKWFERNSISAKWLMRIAALPGACLNLSDYAQETSANA